MMRGHPDGVSPISQFHTRSRLEMVTDEIGSTYRINKGRRGIAPAPLINSVGGPDLKNNWQIIIKGTSKWSVPFL